MSVSYFGRFLVLAFFSAFLASPYSYASPVLKDGNGEVIGAFIGYAAPSGPTTSQQSHSDFLIMSRTGYVFLLTYGWDAPNFLPDFFRSSNAVIRNFGRCNLSTTPDVYFETTDCSGDAYLDGVQSGVIFNTTLNLVEIHENSFTGPTLYYVPKGTLPVTVDPEARLVAGSNNQLECGLIGTGERKALKALPNDPAVTGISRSHFPLPIYFDFDYRFGTPEVFIDRFIAGDQSSQ